MRIAKRNPRAETKEHHRIQEAREGRADWKKWGPYLSERSWGTVREDYSPDGRAWEYLTYNDACGKAYRWGEDGLAGLCDRRQILCLAFAFWNGKDALLKERLFGLSGPEGNHGEDVKEYYFYQDSTPTHSFMQFLYKYPQAAFPYQELQAMNGSRTSADPEYELLNTGVFEGDRYFDLFIEYAKASPEDILIRLTVQNRGPEPAPLHALCQLWFRNTWRWYEAPAVKPVVEAGAGGPEGLLLIAQHPELGGRLLYMEGPAELLFTDNETNERRLYGVSHRDGRFCKDAFHEALVHGRREFLKAEPRGTKAAACRVATVAPGQPLVWRLRLTGGPTRSPFEDFEEIFKTRKTEANEFYAAIHPPHATEDEKRVQRQALSSLLWSKQFYYFNVSQWLRGDVLPPPEEHSKIRNTHWRHLKAEDVISMPDKWEYPWFAAWDLCFQVLPLSLVDLDFAKEQIELMVSERYIHPNGDIPSYEWEFSDLNPPLYAWAAWFLYRREKEWRGQGDREFLRQVFHRLMLHFIFWVNRKDADGNNFFQGGFLGLDNITVFDRSQEAPGGGTLEQADATAWMALFSLNMMSIALELAQEDRVYSDMAIKFFRHYVYISDAINRSREEEPQMWDEEDGFYYDLLHTGHATWTRLRVRSVVGLIPVAAAVFLPRETLDCCQRFQQYLGEFFNERPHLLGQALEYLPHPAEKGYLLSVVGPRKLVRILRRVLDEGEFLSDYGLRSLSKCHRGRPFQYSQRRVVSYEPAEAVTKLKGGNSNWRGPIWLPINYLLLEALRTYHQFFSDSFRVECPVGSGRQCTLEEVAKELGNRLIRLFTRGPDGRRPIHGGTRRFQEDPHWRDDLLFHEYFHAENGAGLGSSHQTGWTALVAELIHELRR